MKYSNKSTTLRTILRILPKQKRKRRYQAQLSEQLECRLLLVAPADPVIVQSVDFTDRITIVDWEPVADADFYDMWFTVVAFDPSPVDRDPFEIDENYVTDSRFEGEGIGSSWSQILSPLNYPGGQRRVWVRAANDDGFGPWGPSVNFTYPGTPESKPDLSVTRNSFYGGSDSFTVSWTSLVETQLAARHEIWVSKDGQRIVNEEQVEATYTSGTLDPGIYRFWVRGESDQLTGAWSDGLTIAVGATQPELTAPVQNEASTRPQISWSAGVPGVPYQLWVQNENGVVINESGIGGTSFTPGSDLADGVYSAWVRQVPASGQPLPWSSRYQFAVGQSRLPEVPVLNFTPNVNSDAVEDRRAIFTWNPAANAVRYELFISNAHNGNVVLRRADITDTNFTTETLATPGEGGSYRAWLRSLGANSEQSLWSEFIAFGIASDTGEVLLT